MKPDSVIILKMCTRLMSGASLLSNDDITNYCQKLSTLANDTSTAITDQVINSTTSFPILLAYGEIGLPNTPPIRTVFLVAEESCSQKDTEYDPTGNFGPSFEQVEN